MRNFIYEDTFNLNYTFNNNLINEAILYAYPKNFIKNRILNIFKNYSDNVKLINKISDETEFSFVINVLLKRFTIRTIKYELNDILKKCQWKIRIIRINNLDSKYNAFSNYDNFIEYVTNKKFDYIDVTIEFVPNKIIYDVYKNNENSVSLDVYKYDYIYHLTDKKYVNKILKNGLIPKSGNKLGYNPEVIHLLKYLTDPGVICKIVEVDGEYKLKVDPKLKLENPVLLKINADMLKNTNVVFLNDPGCKTDNAIITYNQITPLAISVVNDDEYEWLHINQKTI